MNPTTIGCTLSPEEVPARLARFRMIAEAARVVRDTDQGVLLEFSPAARYAAEIMDLVVAERACCAFLRFVLELEAEPDVLRVRIESPAGVGPVRAWWGVLEAE